MHRTIVLFWTVILVLGAGLTVGRLSARLSNPPSEENERHDHRDVPGAWLPDALNLTPDQKKQMDAIWTDFPQTMRKFGDRRRAMDKDREQAFRSLLNDQQLAAYDKIVADYRSQRDGLDKERQNLINQLNERSRALLTDEQKKEWDEMTARMRERRSASAPSTQPASLQKETVAPPGGTEGIRSI
jgi:hypothetical protein